MEIVDKPFEKHPVATALFVLACAVAAIIYFSDWVMPISPLLGPCVSMLSAAIVVLGWRVIYRNSLRIAARNELHQVVSSFMEKVELADKSGCEFWSQPLTKRADVSGLLMTRRFLALLESIRLLSGILKERGLQLDKFDSHFSDLRSALTRDAEDPADIDDFRCSAKIVAISGASRRLRASAYTEFLSCHPHRFN